MKVKNRSLLAADFKEGPPPGGPSGSPGPHRTAGHAGTDGSRLPIRQSVVPLLPLTGDFQPVVTTSALPAGSYVLLSRANLLGDPAGASIICSIGNDAAQGITLGVDQNIALSQTATLTLDTATAVTLNCRENSGAVQVAQASITAIEVAEIKTH